MSPLAQRASRASADGARAKMSHKVPAWWECLADPMLIQTPQTLLILEIQYA